jgi:hypothetical protein
MTDWTGGPDREWYGELDEDARSLADGPELAVEPPAAPVR